MGPKGRLSVPQSTITLLGVISAGLEVIGAFLLLEHDEDLPTVSQSALGTLLLQWMCGLFL
ncbi:hypothetical protein RHECNPAF_2540012 [Rhizobium etli CNPAF512]|nr:hypothetical protein RHECNPAF_2540012 [Rhizobium etli CNPAF512]